MGWRIINDQRTLLGVATDKLAAKEYARRIAARTGLPLRIPETYWVGTDVRELWGLREQLPRRWVFKPNHSSGRFHILDSAKQAIDWDELIGIGTRWVQRDEEEKVAGHPGYRLARHTLIAEERIGTHEDPPATLRAQVAGGKIIGLSYSYGTIHPSNPSPWRRYRYSPDFQRVADPDKKGAAPIDERSKIDELTGAERKRLTATILSLAEGLDQVRVDLYVEEEIWFGELTMYSGSGLTRYLPEIANGLSAHWLLPDLSRPDPREDEWRALLTAVPHGTLQMERGRD